MNTPHHSVPEIGYASRIREQLDRLAEHPWLVGGDPSTPGQQLARRVRVLTMGAIVIANVVGSAVVACFALFALPKPAGLAGDVRWINVAVACGYVLFALIVGASWGRHVVEAGPSGMRAWLYAERAPTAAEQLAVLRAPLRIMVVEAVLWGIAVVLFTLLELTFSGLLALGVGMTVALGGITTSATSYLLAELALRPVASRALAAGAPRRRGLPGVGMRWLLAWGLGTGVPVVGLMLVGIVALTPVPVSKSALAVTTVALCAMGLVFGALVSLLAAYATVHPIASIRAGLARVRRGDLEVVLPVWDSTQMGLLQAGFNEMAEGLRERERIRDLFGRQVGADVARQAVAEDGQVQLGGTVRDVAVLFVDVVGSTSLAATRPPQEVVELLNRFFGEVIDVVEEQGGWINKFQGDAALAIFGAPAALEHKEARALRAARELDARLRARVPELRAAIGVAVGPAVAGRVGAERRFEYTVIGDPVNEAARLTELAKQQRTRVLASGDAIERGGTAEAASWELGEQVQLRGRTLSTRLAHPVEAAAQL
ncbi:MAG TPA: adenylate/guanylate cyclase domain-containing protein [Solirubrobacteraceae bacterium]|nr:adenylate/guanylate cyclase domain-containing protein [Solirubrobacteraceae bacterium]